jgi:hypothetical protein
MTSDESSQQDTGILRVNFTSGEQECVEELIDRDLAHVFDYRGRDPFIIDDITPSQKEMLMDELYRFERYLRKDRNYRFADHAKTAAGKVYESEVALDG